MHPVMNHLTQLQELVLIREEQKVAGNAAHLGRLDESISALTKQLPRAVRTTFQKLRDRDQNVVVPVVDDGCSVCGMKIPRSLVQAIRHGRDMQSCPNCARILYVVDTAPRNLRRRPRRSEPRKPGIARFSSASLMAPKLSSTDTAGTVEELATLMEAEGYVDRSDRLIEEALRREAILCTAVDHGLAFPHVRGVEGGGLTLALGLHRKGVVFDGNKDGLTHIVFFLVIPTAASAFYLKLLSGLTETFMETDARKQLLAAKDQTAMWKILVKVTRKTVK